MGEKHPTRARSVFPTVMPCCSQAEAMCRAPGAKEKAKHDANNNSASPELLGQDNNVPLFAWGSRHRFAPSHLLFLSPNLGINSFVSTAAGNQLGKGTAGVRNAGISFEGICTDDTPRYSTSSAESSREICRVTTMLCISIVLAFGSSLGACKH